jgi:hypothetical protein
MNNEQFDEFLEGALKRHANAPQAIEASVARVMKRLAGPLPRQKMPLWRLPAVLLNWQFSPAWPRMAALGACVAIGFAVGISGLDRRIDRLDGQSEAASSTGVVPLVFEPEELTGARP